MSNDELTAGRELDPINFKLAAASKSLHDRRGKPTGADPALIVQGRMPCDHCNGVTLMVDEDARKVTCSCGAEVNAFDVMAKLARQEERMKWESDHIAQEKRQRRGFYEEKKTVAAQRCKHRRVYPLANGMGKCISCDQVFEAKVIQADGEQA